MSDTSTKLAIALTTQFVSWPRWFFDAYVLMTLWGWFVVPLGVRSLGYWHAFGLDLMIGLVAIASAHPGMSWATQKADEDTPYASLGFAVAKWIAYGFILALGAAAHAFMGAPR